MSSFQFKNVDKDYFDKKNIKKKGKRVKLDVDKKLVLKNPYDVEAPSIPQSLPSRNKLPQTIGNLCFIIFIVR